MGIDPIIEHREREAEDLAQILAERYKLGYVNLNAIIIKNTALHLIDEETARRARVVIFDLDGHTAHIAAQTPNNPELQGIIAFLKTHGLDSEIFLASEFAITKALEVYKETQHTTATTGGALGISEETVRKYSSVVKQIKDVTGALEEIKKQNSPHATSQIAEIVMGCAVALGISDIHIEPEEFSVRIRYRLDGILYDVANISSEAYRKMLARLKLMSGIKLNVTAEAQDGRFTIHLGDTNIEVRVSIVPSTYNQSIVMRLLNPKSINVPLEALGMDEVFYKIMLEEISKPNGMIVTTGPTGSGKTTTLYATLKKLLDPEIKIITIEDPVEYHVTGIAQTQIDHSKGYDFAAGLRAAVRQDPDVVMVGEIRDNETASVAVEAALTGHLVLSTLHTNSAAGAIPRFIDIGVNPKILPSSLNFMIGQRLVRKLCPNCKEAYVPEGYEAEALAREIPEITKYRPDLKYSGQLYRPKGCEVCSGIGFKGRISIYEGIRMDRAIEAIIAKNPSEHEIVEAAKPQGLLSMRQDGIVKAINGVTALSEVADAVGLIDSR
ncbi:MAG TPA: GspE/PulE family protein [Candidatus Paceibacterota bacterium]|nr:GspE/PulE family protein [Candidatus Paceibacterota bacterium]